MFSRTADLICISVGTAPSKRKVLHIFFCGLIFEWIHLYNVMGAVLFILFLFLQIVKLIGVLVACLVFMPPCATSLIGLWVSCMCSLCHHVDDVVNTLLLLQQPFMYLTTF